MRMQEVAACSASSNAQMKACSVAHEQTGFTHVHTWHERRQQVR